MADDRDAEAPESIQVEAARIPDRDRLLETLAEHGIEAHAVDEVGIEVPCGDDSQRDHDHLYAAVEDLLMRIGEPFVPVKKDGTIYLRPPGD
jgi:hypothetical protein